MTTPARPTSRRSIRRRLAGVALVGGIALAACGGGSSSNSSADSTSTTAPAAAPSDSSGGTSEVLPVTSNPITNTATAADLKIDSVLVENNVDAAGKAVDDHLEVALTNTGSTELAGFEVYYTFTDPTASLTESYYTKLPDTFTIAAGESRVVHFDNTGATDHFPANKFSLYSTSVNELDVEVQVSAQGAKVQTATVKKDAGGAETPD
ncbi:MAG: hypothetical protein OSA99_14035 [Acidimicrobiales bacterium]|nr:hypothetical protein [Acidimicrobiales bacterium]